MNTENSKTNESNEFTYQFTDKFKNQNNENIALVNLRIYYTWKNIKLHIITINLKFQPQLGMMNLIRLMVLIQFSAVKITLNLSSKNTKLWLKIFPYIFTPIKSKIRIVFKIKTGHILDLLSPQTMKLLGSAKKMLIKIKMEKIYQN